jgi:dTMP kinase
MFVTFEGIDGSGKTTQVAALEAELRARGQDVVVTREPGGTPLGEGIRRLLLEGPEMTPWAEAALFAAARAELVERVIRPALERGTIVLCDRYLDSSVVYQGMARGLGVAAVSELSLAATGGLLPDVTIVLLLDAEAASERQRDELDRLEREEGEFLRAVAEGYRALVATGSGRFVGIDASRAPEEVAREVFRAVERRLARAA